MPRAGRSYAIEGEERGVSYGGRPVLDAEWKPVGLTLETEFGMVQYERVE